MSWTETNFQNPGLAVHTFYPSSQYSSAIDPDAKSVFIKDYNYIAVGQAAYLALNGEYSVRIRTVLYLAKQMYSPSSEADLYDLLDNLKDGDEAARASFRQVYDWARGFNRQLFDEVLMPSIENWGVKR